MNAGDISDLQFDLSFYACVLLLGFVTYFGIADNSFYKDDYLWMYAGRYEMTAGNLLTYQVVGFFRPFTNLVFYVCEHIRPANSAFYHHTNLLLHLVNSVLWFHLLRLIMHSRFVPAAAALIFVASYNHSGAVLWVSARTTLMMTGFLLVSFLLLFHRPRTTATTALAVCAYAVALATKETAIAGLGLVVFLHFWQNRDAVASRGVVLAYACASFAYVLARVLVLGTSVQSEWEFGLHAVTNLLGGIVYGYYPWELISFFGSTAALRAGTHPWWPELSAFLIVGALLVVARRWGRMRMMTLAVGWIVVALAPAALFRFRFLDMVSHVHNRYYYLAGLGVALSLALLASVLWESERLQRWGRIAAAAVVAIIVVSNVHAVGRLENYWGDSCQRFNGLVDRVIQQMDAYPDKPTVVISGLEGWQPYLTKAAQYRVPGRRIVYGRQGKEAALANAPCLHIVASMSQERTVTFQLFDVD